MTTLAKEYGEWLTSQDWTFFFTFTTNYERPLGKEGAHKLMRRYFKFIGGELAFEPPRIFYVIEKNPSGPGYHVHGLIQSKLSFGRLKKSFQDAAGKARPDQQHRDDFKRYNASKAAAKYCTKELEAKKNNYEFLM